jgi:1,4-dihydroxy-6-naphthoate synthase
VGEAWSSAHGLPLPLGVNVIRRGLGIPLIERVSRACSRSIAWALANRDRLMLELASASGPLDAADLDRYLAMYANADTERMAPDVIRAIETLFAEAARRHLVPSAPPIELAP